MELGLVKREHIKKKSEDDNKKFESEALYKVKKITKEVIKEMDQIKKYGAVALLEVINYNI